MLKNQHYTRAEIQLQKAEDIAHNPAAASVLQVPLVGELAMPSMSLPTSMSVGLLLSLVFC